MNKFQTNHQDIVLYFQDRLVTAFQETQLIPATDLIQDILRPECEQIAEDFGCASGPITEECQKDLVEVGNIFFEAVRDLVKSRRFRRVTLTTNCSGREEKRDFYTLGGTTVSAEASPFQ